ncbi:aminotransferase class III [Candidatus Peribacteria bacterium RIFCSPHIGHO2_02_FULL_53_20]|nr:MAG: aminotransferase class III [Candidatus Peribacteria bacterium RIFCSPHIGHO2_02_FULL_53_20]OGJ67232.1 MAG: aminotransferase class III [Candidatus Peribacteria bacterium RIFCSPLOWO2_01_FULL_53_10]OGJ70663.1 MAG: aminotransferase class III [Candidatus Peribacteria bacterium RIFCSPLOWO2_12_FULL_53_10]
MEGTGQSLYRHAKKLIPGGTQLLSKRPEFLLPEQWPAYFSRIKGVEVWDLDGKKYIDMCQNGVGACVLGAGDPDVDAAVLGAIANGTMSTLNCPEEVELAELLIELHPWAQMARFARCGGEAMAIAARIVRAATRKEVIAFCGYHGWHDWYLSANLADDRTLDGHLLPGLHPLGVPRGLKGTTFPFRYNHLEELEAIVKLHGNNLAAIIMEPFRSKYPDPGFLESIRAIASKTGAVLVFDEVTSGFRVCPGGVHTTLGVEPDVTVFAKGLGNGYPMAAIIGREKVMTVAQDTFISSTNWTERIGPTAALAMIKKFRRENVHKHLIRIGTTVQQGWKDAATKSGISVHVDGLPPLAHFTVQTEQQPAAHTFFAQEMLKHGFLAGQVFYATYAHTDAHVQAYLDAVKEIFTDLGRCIADGSLLQKLEGPIMHTGFHRLT